MYDVNVTQYSMCQKSVRVIDVDSGLSYTVITGYEEDTHKMLKNISQAEERAKKEIERMKMNKVASESITYF